MELLITFIVCFIAGIGAGLGTGFAGMSAAAVISPMLITFLGFDAYDAVGIALDNAGDECKPLFLDLPLMMVCYPFLYRRPQIIRLRRVAV